MNYKKKEISATHFAVMMPFNEAWRKAAKNCGGKWNFEKKHWEFRNESGLIVQRALDKLFGSPNEPTVTLELVAGSEAGHSGNLMLGARCLINVERDCYKVCHDVAIVSADFIQSSGSRANPKLYMDNLVMHIYNVPRSLAETFIGEYNGCYHHLTARGMNGYTIRMYNAAKDIAAAVADENFELAEQLRKSVNGGFQ